ncbi:IniB N-terminal domain-containing protein [Planococcus sp. APC 4015]|nr:IniB N-terminal domain-containing protein [Planococcus sp. APC 4015]
MSLTLATVADALIEFILSLLRDPDVAAEFEDDPEQALISRGLNHASASDVAAVAPVIIERTHVVQVAVPRRVESESHSSPVIREIKQVVSNVQWVDDRDTIVDQSVNQNIWAEGDVTQTFDNDAIVASGDDAVAAGEDALIDKTHDQSTTIEAGEDVNIGNDTDVDLVDGSFNEDSDVSSTVDESVDVVVEDSLDDSSQDVTVEDSFNEQSAVEDSSTTTVTEQVVDGSADSQIVAEPPVAEEPADIAVEEAPLEPVYDSAVEYIETAVDTEAVDEFDTGDTLGTAEDQTDDNF